MDLEIRKYFPIFVDDTIARDWIYFDNAATSQKPQSVIDTITRFYQQHNANVHRASHQLAAAATQRFEQSRTKVQRFINASRQEEIVWTKGATEAINLVASGLGKSYFKPGDHIVLSSTEHHANIVPWKALAEQLGLNISVIPVDDKGVWDLDAGLALLDAPTALLAIGHVSNALGNINPVEPLISKAKKQGALTLLDGAQATAHLPIDVQALGCDFYVFSGHKMFATTGIGVLYGRYERLEALPPYQLGGEMIEKVSFDKVTYQAPPFRFEAGTPNIEGVLSIASAIDFIQQHRAQMEHNEQALYQHLMSRMTEVDGIVLYGALNDTVATQSFVVDGVNSQDLGLLLNEQNIAVRVGHHCAMPLMQALNISGTVRVSLACYNTVDEIDRFIDALTLAIAHLKNGEKVESVRQATLANANNLLANKISAARGWQNIYREIMLAGKSIKPLPQELMTAESEVFGCESQVWLSISTPQEVLNARYYSPSKIVRGLLAILIEPLEGQTWEQVLGFDGQAYLARLGLDKHLSQSRGNGLKSVLSAIQKHAFEQSKKLS